jgi:ankyrin repeat protein
MKFATALLCTAYALSSMPVLAGASPSGYREPDYGKGDAEADADTDEIDIHNDPSDPSYAKDPSFYSADGQEENGRDRQLIKAIRQGKVSLLRPMVEAGASLHGKDEEGRISIHHAVLVEDSSMLSALLSFVQSDEHIFFVNSAAKNRQTPLMLAAEAAGDRTKHISILLAAGADVNAVDNGKNTALMYAVKSKNSQVVKLLVESGADQSPKNGQGWTARGLALASKDGACLEYLPSL